MAIFAYPIEVRDLANTTSDNRKTGLVPSATISAGKTLAPVPVAVLASTVTLVEAAGGVYFALYDPDLNGEAVFPIDWGASLANVNDRYRALVLTKSLLSASGLDAVAVEPGINARQALSPILAACAGIVAGAGTGIVVIKGGNTTVTRITATTDNAGNRPVVTLNPPA
jgi:hypothetical protein